MKKNKLILKIVSVIIFGILISQSIFAQKKKISCVGNSITYGYGLSNPSTHSYPSQMQALLGTAGWQVGNFGDSGRTMLKAGGYSYWDSWYYGQALASNPDYVVIKLGTNDSKRWLWDGNGSKFKSDYKEMIQSFQNLSSKPEIWIGLVVPGEKPDWDIFNSYINDKVNPRIKEIALEKGVGLIDLHAAFAGHWPSWFQTDSIHPTAEGAAEIARRIKEMLLMAKPEISFANGKVTAPDGDDYQWYLNGMPVGTDNGGKLKEMNVPESGKYKVSIKLNAANETRIVSKELDVQQTSVSSIYSNKIKVYPNPAFDVIQVEAENIKKNATYTITDLSGKILLKGQIRNGHGKINIATLSKGTYILAIGNEQIKVIKAK